MADTGRNGCQQLDADAHMAQHGRNQLSRALRAATDKELADFMAGFHSGSMEWVLCQQELARRQGGSATIERRTWIAIGILIAVLLVLVLLNLPIGHR